MMMILNEDNDDEDDDDDDDDHPNAMQIKLPSSPSIGILKRPICLVLPSSEEPSWSSSKLSSNNNEDWWSYKQRIWDHGILMLYSIHIPQIWKNNFHAQLCLDQDNTETCYLFTYLFIITLDY